MRVINSETLFIFFEKRKGYKEITKIFMDAVNKRQEILLSAVDWADFYSAVISRYGKIKASEIKKTIAWLPVKIVEVDAVTAEKAAVLEAEGNNKNICYSMALAKSRSAELVVF